MAPLPSLAAVPLEQLDAEFEARVRAAPRAEQDRLLSEADLLRAAAQDAHSWRALTIYRALHARLGDGTSAGLERAAWCCQEDPARDDVARRVAEVALGHPGEDERIEAERTLGQCDLVAGRVAEAEASLTALFARVRDHLRERMAVARVEGRLPAWATAAAGNMTAVCAWCRSVRTAQGRWLPLGHFVPSTGPHLTVTHGICEDCRPRLGLG